MEHEMRTPIQLLQEYPIYLTERDARKVVRNLGIEKTREIVKKLTSLEDNESLFAVIHDALQLPHGRITLQALNYDHTQLFTIYEHESKQLHTVKIQHIRSLTGLTTDEELEECCSGCEGHITFEKLDVEHQLITHYCHACNQYQYCKYKVIKTELTRGNYEGYWSQQRDLKKPEYGSAVWTDLEVEDGLHE
jgi:hypothetical protein